MRLRKNLLLATILLSSSVWGEDEVPDFSVGLDRLSALAFPEMKGAVWVKLADDSSETFTGSYEFQELNIRTSGNAWKLASTEPAFLEFGSASPLGGSAEDSVEDNDSGSEKPSIFGKMLRKYNEKNPEPEKAAPPKEAESLASRDVKKIVAALGKPNVAEEIENSMRWGNSVIGGRILLFAAQLRAAGDSESADLLANTLFQVVSNDEALIDQALTHLGDTEYDKIATQFFDDYDWDAYLSSCRALLGKFPRGWANAPAVALLVSRLEKRESTPPATPSLPGVVFNPEALALIEKVMEKADGKVSDEELARARGIDLKDYPARQRAMILDSLREEGLGVSYNNTGLWLLPSDDAEEEADSSSIGKLQALGMDSVIVLAAIAGDESLVPVRKSRDGSSGYYSSDESPAENIRRRYENLNRPVSRGEIAKGLLSGVVPTQEDEYGGDQIDSDSVADAATELWTAHRDDTAVELAVFYMQEGSESQRVSASAWLAASADPSAAAAFEAAVLKSDDPLSAIMQVDAYLSRRKVAAKHFADAYIKLLKENPPDEEQLRSSRVGYQIRDAGGLDSYLQKLSLRVGDVSLKKLIAKALKAKATSTDENESGDVSPLAALAPSLQGISMEECLLEFGKIASLATPEQWMEILQLLRKRTYYDMRNPDDEEEVQAIPLSKDVIDIWAPLVASADALPDAGDIPEYARAYGGETVGDASALILEMAADPRVGYWFNSFVQIESSSSPVMDFVRERTDALVAGKEAEPWPSASNVSEERRSEIFEKLASLSAAEIIPYAQELSRDERLALTEIVGEYDESNPAPPGLLELRQTIVSLTPVFAAGHDSDAAAKLGLAVGDKFTPELLTKISDDFLNDAASSSSTSVAIFPAAMNLGVTLHVSTARDLDKMKIQSSGIQYLAQIFDQFGNKPALSAIYVGQAGDMRALVDGKPATLESEGSGLTNLMEALEGKNAILPAARISILTLEDAEKINNQDQ